MSAHQSTMYVKFVYSSSTLVNFLVEPSSTSIKREENHRLKSIIRHSLMSLSAIGEHTIPYHRTLALYMSVVQASQFEVYENRSQGRI